jgi:hypothetical protein
MTAEEMEDHYGGVKFSLWHYWKAKKMGRIPYRRLIEYLQGKGHHGFFREMVWHPLPMWLEKLLYASRKAGTLDSFVIPPCKPKGTGKKK